MGSVTVITNAVTHITWNTFVQMHVVTKLVLCECKIVLQREEGDFIISDKLTVGHQVTPDTQLPTDVVSLHVSHHTTIKGTVPPAK